MTMRVAIIGGGYAGYALARALDSHVDVTLIEAREAFVHNVAAIRAVAQSELTPRIVLPYDRLLKNGRVIQGRATAVSANGVAHTGGSSVPSDIVVVATGSTYAAPFKPQGDSAAAFAATLALVSQQVRENDHIVIVGAGAVGVELAGELKAAYPQKRVSLVSSLDKMFPHYPQKLHKTLVAKLSRAGVDLHMGDAASDLARSDIPYVGEVTLRSRTRLAGLVVPAIGAHAPDGPGQLLPGVTKRLNGQLAVDPWLRPSTLPNIFAIGDLIDTGEGMTVVATTRQAPWLAKTIRSLASGKALETLPAYKPWPMPPILLPLGPNVGASVLPFSRSGTVVGDWVTSAIKGKALFIPRYHKEFGLEAGWPQAPSAVAREKI
jgi:NADH dehydrogenase FAD-containing subunit